MFYHNKAEPHCFAFLMIDGLSMMSLASATEPLRAANRLLGREAFRWDLCSIDGTAVTSSSGLPLPAVPVDEAIARNHALFLCGGVRVNPQDERPYLVAMRRAARSGLAIGALSTASYLVARAGLLDGYRCTIHWENRTALEEDFPDLQVTGTLFEVDRNRLTCSGGTAAMDLMLQIIADLYGRDLARGVANQFHHARMRGASEDQQGGRTAQMDALPQALQTVIRLMQANIETPLSIDRLARMAKISERQLERNFHNFLGQPPTRHYLMIRIERAREMLLYTEQPVIDIAVATGFASTSHLSRWVKNIYGISPTRLRAKGREERARSQGRAVGAEIK